MNPITIAKTATEIIVATGAAAVVSNAIKASTPETAKLVTKVSIGVGGFVLSSMAGEMAVKYTMTKIDEGVQQFKDAKDAFTKKTDPEPTTES